MPNEQDSKKHFLQWIKDQIDNLPIVLEKNQCLSKKDNLILSQAYCRNFPNRLPFILARLIEDERTV